MTILDQLLTSIRGTAVHNSNVQVAPACVLWPDGDRQWEAIVPVLRVELPELLVLGDYAPDERSGPGIWLRCAVAGKVDGLELAQGRVPVIYLPGVSRQDLRAVETCPDPLKPLAELQYRGVIWSQLNGKDWTVLAYLKSDQGGLGFDVAQDAGTRHAMQLALHRLIDEDTQLLQGKRLDQDYFNTLLTGGDPVRDLLQWLDQGEAFRSARADHEWHAFVEVCKSQLAFNPQQDGVLAGAARLAEHAGPWQAAWQRYCEAPKRYPFIPDAIRKCQPPAFDLFTDAETAAGWPQWNAEQEAELARDLMACADMVPEKARQRMLELEQQHHGRRSLVWAELGESPLAAAIEHLSQLAQHTTKGLAAGTIDDLTQGYAAYGWRADDAAVRALAEVTSAKDVEVVVGAVRSIYLPWCEASARHLQKIWASAPIAPSRWSPQDPSTCILFIDGLRYDCAKRLIALLEGAGHEVTAGHQWAALPSITGTAKPAIAPLATNAVAEDAPSGFVALTRYQFEKALKENGWLLVRPTDAIPSPILPSPDHYDESACNKLWVEVGNLDHEGHDRGWKIVRHIDTALSEVQERLDALFEAGWRRVQVVTDHGWLLAPGGLPKTDLPAALTEGKWGRCAILKPGAFTDEKLYPWFWNPTQQYALAAGISCYRKGTEYAHGGLSLQECLTLHLTVQAGATATSTQATFTDVIWKGLRCTVAVEGASDGVALDLRTEPGAPESSVALARTAKPLKNNGTVSIVVENEDCEGKAVMLVLLDASGELVAQMKTIVGGDEL